ncbi:hypothetical protein DZC72_16800 [Maribacter algicola]|uniref:Uncharacterized protein n=1 Tax=Maribacter algicola TaxID=2498892 RepID=A0A426RFE6_9FLAO|nr:hypothetical protein DZC72_16800 [Maribacter algicola]
MEENLIKYYFLINIKVSVIEILKILNLSSKQHSKFIFKGSALGLSSRVLKKNCLNPIFEIWNGKML